MGGLQHPQYPQHPQYRSPQPRSPQDRSPQPRSPQDRSQRPGWLGWFRLWRLVPIALVAVLAVGCVDVDVEIRFTEANHGTLVQTLRFDEGWQVWGGATTRDWLDRWADRARATGGRIADRSDRSLRVEIPFHNGRDLQRRMRALAQPWTAQATAPTPAPSAQAAPVADRDLTDPIDSLDPLDRLAFPQAFELRQQNWLVAVRNQLHYEVDLRSLAAWGSDRLALVDPDSLLDWQVRLQAPRIAPDAAHPGPPDRRSWRLEPGQLNRIDAIFWVPSWLGIGSLVIILFCAIGWWQWRSPEVPDQPGQGASDPENCRE